MENPTEPQGHYGCSRQPRHNPLICEVITNHYTVGFHSSDINTWPQRTARPTLPCLFLNHWLSYLSPTFYMSLEKRVIKSVEIAWARTSDAVRQNMCIPVQWDKQRHDERWKGSLLCICKAKETFSQLQRTHGRVFPTAPCQRPGYTHFPQQGCFYTFPYCVSTHLNPQIPCRKI